MFRNGCKIKDFRFGIWICCKFKQLISSWRQNKSKDLDLNIDNKAMIDWSKDTRDMGDHLNYYGAYKVSNYLGNYLNKLDILEDHRGNDYYSSWDNALKPYQDEVKKANIN